MVTFFSLFLLGALQADASVANFRSPASAPKSEIVVRLSNEVFIDGEVATLASSGEINADRQSDQDKLRNITLAQLPDGAKEITVPGAYIRQRIIEELGPDRVVKVEVPNKVTFKHRKKLVSIAELKSFVIDAIRTRYKPSADVIIEANPESNFEPIALGSNSEMKLETMGVPVEGSARTTLQLTIKDLDTKTTQRILIPMQVTWKAERWISARSLRNRDTLSPADFEKRLVEISSRDAGPVPSLDADVFADLVQGAHLRRTIGPGVVLTNALIYRDPDISRGQKLRVVIRSESGLEIHTAGEALVNGSIGDPLKVRLDKTGRVVSGQLKSKDLLEMTL